MNWPLASIPSALRPALEERLARLDERAASPACPTRPARPTRCRYVWACSDFVADACLRDRELLPWLFAGRRLYEADRSSPIYERDLESSSRISGVLTTRHSWTALRRFRRRHLARIAWRDLAGLAESIRAARTLAARRRLHPRGLPLRGVPHWQARHGAPRGSDGAPLELLVLAMGKLGGGELNFSSDIDLVFAVPRARRDRVARGRSSTRSTSRGSAGAWRSCSAPSRPRASSTASTCGCGRSAIRVRRSSASTPWRTTCSSTAATGSATPTSRRGRCTARTSFDELYRNVLRPFVYRRYLDFSVFESLREMKELIAREVERRELRDNVKLGPGGIREIEFIVQAFQLIRGGGKPALQTRSLLEALPLLAGHKLLSPEAVAELGESYRFLRRVENRLQQRNDEQTHELPTGRDRARASRARDGGRGLAGAGGGDRAAPATRQRPFPDVDLRAGGAGRRRWPGSRARDLARARDRRRTAARAAAQGTHRRRGRGAGAVERAEGERLLPTAR